MDLLELLSLFGLILDFIGASILTVDLFMTKEQAVETGLSRWGSNDDEENLKLPQVQHLLKQSQKAKFSFLIITVGFLLQIFGSLPFCLH
jgi:hypothetical protein